MWEGMTALEIAEAGRKMGHAEVAKLLDKAAYEQRALDASSR